MKKIYGVMGGSMSLNSPGNTSPDNRRRRYSGRRFFTAFHCRLLQVVLATLVLTGVSDWGIAAASLDGNSLNRHSLAMLSGMNMARTATSYEVSDTVRDQIYLAYFQSWWKYGDQVIVQTDVDQDDDGTIDSVEKNSYSDDGNLAKSVCTGDDSYIITYTCNENGYLVKEETDADSDGDADTVYDYSYADDDVKITFATTIDSITYTNVLQHVFGSDGTLTGMEWTFLISLSDISSSEYHTYTYDDDGNLAKDVVDYDSDGTIDEVRVYTYDENGNCVKLEYYSGDDTTAYYVLTGTYGSDNLCQKEEVDSDNDGNVDTTFYYTWSSLSSSDADDSGDDTSSSEDSDDSDGGSSGGGGCFISSLLGPLK